MAYFFQGTNKRFSTALKIISHLPIVAIPREILTDRLYFLRTSLLSENDAITEQILNNEEIFGDGRCVVAQIQYCDVGSGSFSSKPSSKKLLFL